MWFSTLSWVAPSRSNLVPMPTMVRATQLFTLYTISGVSFFNSSRTWHIIARIVITYVRMSLCEDQFDMLRGRARKL